MPPQAIAILDVPTIPAANRRRGTHPVHWLILLLLVSLCLANAENPCRSLKQRALVLSGGGVKGAFEAGAVYHLVVQRGCDFGEFSGVSVGALNAVFLAQAQEASDANESHANLVDQSEALVSLWQSLRSSHDFARNRPLATLRFGTFRPGQPGGLHTSPTLGRQQHLAEETQTGPSGTHRSGFL